eukprot:1663501-Prorocentrum_lima.AAC.1
MDDFHVAAAATEGEAFSDKLRAEFKLKVEGPHLPRAEYQRLKRRRLVKRGGVLPQPRVALTDA